MQQMQGNHQPPQQDVGSRGFHEFYRINSLEFQGDLNPLQAHD